MGVTRRHAQLAQGWAPLAGAALDTGASAAAAAAVPAAASRCRLVPTGPVFCLLELSLGRPVGCCRCLRAAGCRQQQWRRDPLLGCAMPGADDEKRHLLGFALLPCRQRGPCWGLGTTATFHCSSHRVLLGMAPCPAKRAIGGVPLANHAPLVLLAPRPLVTIRANPAQPRALSVCVCFVVGCLPPTWYMQTGACGMGQPIVTR